MKETQKTTLKIQHSKSHVVNRLLIVLQYLKDLFIYCRTIAPNYNIIIGINKTILKCLILVGMFSCFLHCRRLAQKSQEVEEKEEESTELQKRDAQLEEEAQRLKEEVEKLRVEMEKLEESQKHWEERKEEDVKHEEMDENKRKENEEERRRVEVEEIKREHKKEMQSLVSEYSSAQTHLQARIVALENE